VGAAHRALDEGWTHYGPGPSARIRASQSTNR
jgi:hypothetical protein